MATCGYEHPSGGCLRDGIQFICRYLDCNDYCVSGKRITVHDDGRTHSTCAGISVEEFRAILLYELDKYAEYCQWKAADERFADMPLLPFTHPTVQIEEVF